MFYRLLKGWFAATITLPARLSLQQYGKWLGSGREGVQIL
jgi:hypothetical protein